MLILFFYKINTYIILGINQISCPYVNVFFVQEDVWAWVKSYDPSLLKNQHVNKKLKKKTIRTQVFGFHGDLVDRLHTLTYIL